MANFSISQNGQAEYIVQKSRFIGYALHLDDKHTLQDFCANLAQSHPDARHICYGYVLDDGKSAGSFDAGEPSGTAGKPIVNVLQKRHIVNAGIVVVRYFGGVKLGAGGLCRAYSHSANLALENALTCPFICYENIVLDIDFAHESNVRAIAMRTNARLITQSYSNAVRLEFAINTDDKDAFLAQIARFLR